LDHFFLAALSSIPAKTEDDDEREQLRRKSFLKQTTPQPGY
jgi:hypothetical protein